MSNMAKLRVHIYNETIRDCVQSKAITVTYEL